MGNIHLTSPSPSSEPQPPSDWQWSDVIARPTTSFGAGFLLILQQPHYFQTIHVPTTWRNLETKRKVTESRDVSAPLGIQVLLSGEIGYSPFNNDWIRHSIFGGVGIGPLFVSAGDKEGYEPVKPAIDYNNIVDLELRAGSGLMLTTPYVRPYANFLANGIALLGNDHLDDLLRNNEGQLRHDFGLEAGIELDSQFDNVSISIGDPSSTRSRRDKSQSDRSKIRLSWIRMGGKEATNAIMLGALVYY